MAPQLRALVESGATFDDPSEDVLFELLSAVDRGDELFLIVERPADASGQTYLQVLKQDDGSWLVEQRDGSPESHSSSVAEDLRSVHAAMTTWASGPRA